MTSISNYFGTHLADVSSCIGGILNKTAINHLKLSLKQVVLINKYSIIFTHPLAQTKQIL